MTRWYHLKTPKTEPSLFINEKIKSKLVKSNILSKVSLLQMLLKALLLIYPLVHSLNTTGYTQHSTGNDIVSINVDHTVSNIEIIIPSENNTGELNEFVATSFFTTNVIIIYIYPPNSNNLKIFVVYPGNKKPKEHISYETI